MTSKNKKQRNCSDSAGLNAVWLYVVPTFQQGWVKAATMAAFCFLTVFFKPRRNLGKTDAGKVRNQNKLRKIKDFLRPYFRFSGFSPLALWAWAFLISFHLTQIFLFGILLSRVSRVRFPGGSPNSNNPNTIQIDGVFGFLFYL